MKYSGFHLVCLALAAASASSQAVVDQAVPNPSLPTCDTLRREMAILFQQVYEKKITPSLMKRFIPNLIEISLPLHCDRQWNLASAVAQPPASLADPVLPDPQVADANFPRMKRYMVGGQITVPDLKDAWSMYANAPDQGRQVRDLAQMLNYLRKINGIQSSGLASEYSTLGPAGDAFTFGQEGSLAGSLADMKPRMKRFLFTDPFEGPYVPSLFSIMMGAAQDPNTGKRIEFGGDIMRNMIANTFLSFMPVQPPAGKEATELVKNIAPVWYISNLQRAMNPASPRVEPKNVGQKRTQDGFYGDPLTAKIRKRRESSEKNIDAIWVNDVPIPHNLFESLAKAEEEGNGGDKHQEIVISY